jgi:hypothetical protein
MLVQTHTPTVRCFQVADLDAFDNRDGAQIPREVILGQTVLGPTWTACVDEAPMAIGGIALPWPGIGMAWMIVGVEMVPYRIWFTRTVKQFMLDTILRYDLHRLEAQALDDSLVNQAWLERLGFHVEQHGRAHAYLADHRTIIRYEWVREGT